MTAPDDVQNVALAEADKEAIRNIQHDWRVDHHINLYTQKENGSLRKTSDIAFARGDFVEVKVMVDIVTFWDTKANRLCADIQYAPVKVTKLHPARRAKVEDFYQYW